MIRTGRKHRLDGCSAINVNGCFKISSLSLTPDSDGYGRVDAGKFVEAAESWTLVKPQAWFDSPAVYLPDDYDTRLSVRQDDGENDGTNPDQSDGGINPPPIVQPAGSLIVEGGVTSTYEVTQSMLDDSNFEELEHVTIRVWINHQRRGDVEAEITSPNGITSVLARQRRFDDADTGYPGWKFMSLKHWCVSSWCGSRKLIFFRGENPVGTWTIKVMDQINPDATGRFVAWSLQLWGECVDASLAREWSPAEEGQPDEEQTGSDPSATVSQKPKPTEHLPGDHGEAAGEADQPGLGGTATAAPTGSGDEDITEPTGDVDEGFFDGIESLGSSSAWLVGAVMIIVLTGTAIGGYFYYRASRRRRNLFGLANQGEGGRGTYAPVSENVPMGLLERGRRKLGGGIQAGAGSKELYDAFGDGPSDESDDDREGAGDVEERMALKYHDDFLGDDDPASADPPEYRDEPDVRGGKGRGASTGGRMGGESTSGSSSSWQDAAEDVPRP